MSERVPPLRQKDLPEWCRCIAPSAISPLPQEDAWQAVWLNRRPGVCIHRATIPGEQIAELESLPATRLTGPN